MAGATMAFAGRTWRDRILLVATGALTASTALVGGVSQIAPVPRFTLELLAIFAGIIASRRVISIGAWRGSLWPFGLTLAMFAVPLVQLAPLPPEWWLKAPGLQPRFTATILSGLDLAAGPLSLDPAATRIAVAALLPPSAMFVCTLVLKPSDQRWIVTLLLAIALAGLGLGLIQMTQPDGGWAYLYGETNTGSLVGWFANRNHEAALLLALMPLTVSLLFERGGPRWIAVAFLLVVMVALAANRSRAGLILVGPTAALSAAVLWRDRRARHLLWAPAAFAGVAALSAAAVAAFALTPILARFGADSGPEFRYRAWPVIWDEAVRHLPFGSGVGSFDRVYRAIEPIQFVAPAYFNHAHNDYLELWLETGWLGALILAGLGVWFATRARAAWTADGSRLARAASVSVIVLAAMSWVDYPLRTEALATIFAFCLGVMTAARRRDLAPNV